MTDTPLLPAPAPPSVQRVVERIAVPFLSFSSILFVSLLVSQCFVLPRLTTFRVGEVTVSVDEALAYERTLKAEVLSLEDARAQFVLPYIDETHAALMQEKRALPSIMGLRRQIETTMQGVADDVGASVVIEAILLDARTATVTLRGHVDDPHPSSIAVLAAAIDRVRALPQIVDLTPPALTREEIPGGGYRSPFTLSFRLLPS